MTDRIDRDELIARVVERTGNSPKTVEKIVDVAFEGIYEAIKRGQSASPSPHALRAASVPAQKKRPRGLNHAAHNPHA